MVERGKGTFIITGNGDDGMMVKVMMNIKWAKITRFLCQKVHQLMKSTPPTVVWLAEEDNCANT